MKGLVNYLILKIISFAFFLRFRNSTRTIVVFDLDNTLADTWPSLLKCDEVVKGERARLLSLKIFDSIRECLLLHLRKGDDVVIVTVRRYRFYFVTRLWLNNNGLNGIPVFLVRRPADKVDLIRRLDSKVIVYDDLSHSHEKGAAKYYEEEIRFFSESKNIEYYGYDFLRVLQDETKKNT